MTREEERKEVAKNRANQYSHPVEWNDCYKHWIEGAEWADSTMIEKACKWLLNHNDYLENPYANVTSFNMAKLVADFRKAMEE